MPTSIVSLSRPVARTTRAAALALAAAIGAAASAQGDDVPFVTTPDAVTEAMLALAGVGPRDRLVDLGSGDGRIVIAAARRHGARGLGVEIVPALVEQSRAAARAAGVADRVEFRQQDLFRTDLTGATVVTMYLLPDVNLQLRPRLAALAPGTRIVSHDWDLGDWAPDRTVTVDVPDKALGRDKFSRVHLWIVPARVHGRWCGDDGTTLELEQRFQRFSATVVRGDPALPPIVLDGRIEATTLRGDGLVPLSFALDGARLRRTDDAPRGAGLARTFAPASGATCR